MTTIDPWILYTHFTAKQACALAVGDDPAEKLSTKGLALWYLVREAMLSGELGIDIKKFLPEEPKTTKATKNIDAGDTLQQALLKVSTTLQENSREKQRKNDLENKIFRGIKIHRRVWRKWFDTLGQYPSFLYLDQQKNASSVADAVHQDDFPRLLKVAAKAWHHFYESGKTYKKQVIVEELLQWDDVSTKGEANAIDFLIRPDEMKRGGHIKNNKIPSKQQAR